MPARVDVLVVGAGISGIGAGYHLKTQCPGKSFLILEAQTSFGGTWRTHRYPGVRSDSDLYTFGYRFKPWVGPPIATADQILGYLGEVIEENELGEHIRYGYRIESARWVSADRVWHLQVLSAAGDKRIELQAGFLWMCQGYYDHGRGYTPQWPGMARFAGTIVHPQHWPDALDLRDRRVVVIGSGATAATLVPAIAQTAAHVTMLQRSPTYFVTGRNANELAQMLRDLEIPQDWIHEIVRRKILKDQLTVARRAFEEPEALARDLVAGVKAQLPAGVDAERHFTPRYAPWRQRIAFVPDADLFASIRSGKASVVTDEIARFTETGLELASGQLLDADVIITATGFNLSVMGGIAFSVDDRPVDFSATVGWRGAMFTGVPNLVWTFGYFRASWTLRVDLLADLVCRLLDAMDRKQATWVMPQLRAQDEAMMLKPWVDPDNFNPGYLARSLQHLPRQGEHDPWLHTQDYWSDRQTLPQADLEDGSLIFE